MKKIILSIGFLALVSFTTLADERAKLNDGIESISVIALRQFGYDFYKATKVSWTTDNNYQKARFVMDGKSMSAIYGLDGQFLVATETIKITEIPVPIKASLDKSFAGYEINSIVKVIARAADYQLTDDTGSYWASLTGKQTEVVVLIAEDTDLKVVKTSKLAE